MRAIKRGLYIVAVVIFTLVFSLSGSVAASSGDSQGEAAPKIRQYVIVHYVQGHEYTELYQFIDSGIRWADPTVDYYINLGRRDATFVDGINNAFDVWDDASGPYEPVYQGTTKSSPGSLQAKWSRRQQQFVGEKNVVGWKKLGKRYQDAIAITYLWGYDTESGPLLVEVDTAFNSDRNYQWWQIPNGTNENWPELGYESDAYDVDVQNIMAHEAGHWLVLLDLYNPEPPDCNQTMYGYSSEYELKKRSLESGDIAGIRAIYGN